MSSLAWNENLRFSNVSKILICDSGKRSLKYTYVGNIRIISSRSTKILIGVKDRAIKTRHCPFERSMRRAIRETVQAEQKFRDVWGEQSLTLEFHYFAVASDFFENQEKMFACILFYSFRRLNEIFRKIMKKMSKTVRMEQEN